MGWGGSIRREEREIDILLTQQFLCVCERERRREGEKEERGKEKERDSFNTANNFLRQALLVFLSHQ